MSRSAAPRPENLKFVEPLHSAGAGRGVPPGDVEGAAWGLTGCGHTAVEGGTLLLITPEELVHGLRVESGERPRASAEHVDDGLADQMGCQFPGQVAQRA
jgi:hypothetical protein